MCIDSCGYVSVCRLTSYIIKRIYTSPHPNHFIHSFIHIEHLHSASSRKLLRSAPNTNTVKQSSLKVRKNAGEVVIT